MEIDRTRQVAAFIAGWFKDLNWGEAPPDGTDDESYMISIHHLDKTINGYFCSAADIFVGANMIDIKLWLPDDKQFGLDTIEFDDDDNYSQIIHEITEAIGLKNES